MSGISTVHLRPSPSDFRHHSLTNDIDTGDAIGYIGIAALVILIAGSALGFLKFSVGPGAGGGGGGNACSSSPSTTSQQLKFTASAFSGDSALTAPTASVYGPQVSWANLGSDNPGSLSSAVTTGGSYSLQGGLVVQFAATGANPIWAPINGQPFSQGGVTTMTVQSTPGSVAGTCLWLIGATPIQAPGSGTSATTNVAALVTSADGSALTTASVSLPRTSTMWTAALNIKSGYKGLGYPQLVPSVQSATVVNYQNGQTVPLGQFQKFETVLIVSINRTDIVFNLDASSSGLTMASITNTAATASTLNYVVYGFNGCTPAASSVSTYACLSANFDVYQTGTQTAKHTAFTFIWADMQEPAYVITHFTNPAVTSYPSSGAAAGIPTSFAFLVPTSAPNNGAPTVLVEQSYTVIQSG